DFEYEISDEEQAGAQSEGCFTQSERLVHVQLGKADIDAIEIRDEVAQDQEWNEPPHDLADGALLDVFHGAASRFVTFTKSRAAFCKVMTLGDDECNWHFLDVRVGTGMVHCGQSRKLATGIDGSRERGTFDTAREVKGWPSVREPKHQGFGAADRSV